MYIMKTTKQKIASSGTIEGLQKLINEFYYSTTCYIENMKVYNKNGIIENSLVDLKKNKYYYYLVY